MLRTRFTLAVAAAVAAVTLAITAVAFIVVRADLQDQVRRTSWDTRRRRATGWRGTTTGTYPPDGFRRTRTGSARPARTPRW